MDCQLTKTDVARRQLVTAIRLFFQNDDPVSIYSLAANAWEVIDVLCNRARVASLSNETRGHVPSGKDLKNDYVNSPYRNFFKHADRDPDALLTGFDASNVDSILMLAVEDYLRLHKRSPVEFQAFQLWYLATHINKVADGALASIVLAIDRLLPNIRNVSRAGQIAMGKKFLAAARHDEALLTDVRTEAS